ncbi:putative leucine-rich repeat-containing, plant-type, leucine-rich repeat domain superfamily [Helianthus debilis subsp. tardiflorus]
MMSLFGSLLLCILFMSGDLGSSCIEKERQALLDVKANLTGLDESIYDWGSNEEKMDCCKWLGVFCSDLTGHVTYLSIGGSGSTANIPRCFDNFTAMARRSFRDDVFTSHAYSSAIPAKCYFLNGNECPSDPVEEAQFLDNAWVAWKGAKRLFGKSGLSLLKSIDLSRNNLSGKIPNAITGLFELVSLNLSVNKLHGEVPKDMGRLKSLESLDLSRNEFSGHIPWSLAQLNFLSYLDLSFNNLSGRIPIGSQLQRFSYTSYSGNPQLCGPPLTPRCGFVQVAEKKDVKEEDDDSWKLYYMGMGVGFAFGFLGICGALILNHRCRYFVFASLSHMKDWMYVIMVVHFGNLVRKFR